MTRRMANRPPGECVGCVPVLVGKHVIQWTGSTILWSLGVCLTLATDTTSGLDYMDAWSGMDFSAQL